jgi:hypothetical protein
MAAPKGNNFAGNALIARKALMDALAVRDGTQGPKEGIQAYNTLVDMWDKQIDQALEGNNDSFKHIVERLDGKAPQEFNIGGKDGNPIQIGWTILPVKSNAADTGS